MITTAVGLLLIVGGLWYGPRQLRQAGERLRVTHPEGRSAAFEASRERGLLHVLMAITAALGVIVVILGIAAVI